MIHTLESIAKLAGVSRGTVSRVVNKQAGVKPLVRDKVLRIIEETGYQPNAQARSLAGGKTLNIGVAVFGKQANFLNHHIFYEVLQGAQSHLTTHFYDLLLFANRAEDDREYWKRIGEKRKVDGLIVMGENIREEYLIYFYEMKLPFVLVGKRHFHQVPLNCVTSDYRQGAYQATLHLLQQGRQRIVFLRGDPDTYHEGEKLAGYQQALREAGHGIDLSLIVNGSAQQVEAYASLQEAIARGLKFDGLFAGNDLMAFGAIEALRANDLAVPEDVSIVGYDDIQAASYFNPQLSTVRQNKRQLGESASELLLQLLNAPSAAAGSKDILIANELIVRGSSLKGDKGEN